MKLPRGVELISASIKSGRRTYLLSKPLRVKLSNGIKIKVEVPAGFETDFASIPRLLWPLFPPDGPWLEASIVHDYCYREQVPFSRFFADALFRELMRQYEVPWWRRILFFWAVRLFGWIWWKKQAGPS